ncbi:hypothetical protein [Streptomyces sp. HC307]|uniref:hypothetical protein n=1 Tax=Streptomyces flavusporus TaxID=3385496 RepID=UPI003916CD6A
MAVKAKTVYIAVCDLCGAAYGEDEQWEYHFDTPNDALAWVEGGTGWLKDGDQLICDAPDDRHDQARIPGVLL